MTEDGITKRLWLHMLAEGGRWTVRELAQDTKSDYSTVNGTLMRMYDAGGSVCRYVAEGKSAEYGISEKCIVPKNITLAELRAAMQKAGEVV